MGNQPSTNGEDNVLVELLLDLYFRTFKHAVRREGPQWNAESTVAQLGARRIFRPKKKENDLLTFYRLSSALQQAKIVCISFLH